MHNSHLRKGLLLSYLLDPPRYPQGAASLVGTFFDQTTEEIWDMIVQETNHCYEQKVAAEPNEKRNKMEPCI